MPRFPGGILDLDGVVVDSEALHLEATKIVFERYELRLPDEGTYGFIGRTDRAIFSDAVEASGRVLDVPKMLAVKNEVYETIADRMQLIPGSDAFIRWVAGSESKLALVTSSMRVNQQRAFDLFGLHPFFDVVITADDVQRTKPDPEPYETAVGRFGLDARDCFVVEDSFNGVRSAKGAGCYVIGLTSSFPSERLKDAGADVVFDTFEEVRAHVA